MAFFAGAVVLGAVLRFWWLPDMEYKGDERFMFDRSQRIPSEEPWPELGMPSGAGLRNPGMSIWVFAVLAKLFGAHDPIALDRAVVICNVTAFALLFLFVVRSMPEEEREPWLWGLALAAVNPLALLLQRKIWAQSVLPIFCVTFLIGWLRRDRWWGAIVWGLLGAILGQIHMSGFFFAAGFVVWELGVGRIRPARPKTKWLGWLGGSVAGAVTLIPWIKYVLSGQDHGPPYDWDKVLSFKFFRYWFSDTLGLGLDYSLGAQYLDFLRFPIIASEPARSLRGNDDVYPVLYLHGIAFVIGAYILLCAVRALWSTRAEGWRGAVARVRSMSETALTSTAAFFAYGLLLTFSGVVIWRHYMLVTFPLEWMTLAYLARAYAPRSRRLLLVLWGAELALSIAFLNYIHVNHGALGGDYGRGFRWQ